LTEDAVKKCGSVGIYFIIATQKPTSDAIPTAIRANLTHGLCLADGDREAGLSGEVLGLLRNSAGEFRAAERRAEAREALFVL
ncbi:hypothetical protein, partial [Nocardia gipuzkoensis]|uniref:hypothetical protein n=1 Tax=Nocardia gipuzkoensis TaxID=2749991 RepID=UPI001C6793C4